MNVQRSLIQKLNLDEFERGHNAAEASKKICNTESKGEVDRYTHIKWF